jgi:hypothetical protein
VRRQQAYEFAEFSFGKNQKSVVKAPAGLANLGGGVFCGVARPDGGLAPDKGRVATAKMVTEVARLWDPYLSAHDILATLDPLMAKFYYR